MKKISLIFLFGAFFTNLTNASAVHVDKNVSFKTDVIGINEQQLYPKHWLRKVSKNNVLLMSNRDILKLNERLVKKNRFIVNPLSFPNSLQKITLLKLMDQISRIPRGERFYTDGSKVSKLDYSNYENNLNKSTILADNKVLFGLAVKRSSLRTFPTEDKVYKKGKDRDLDRFQESALFPGDAVAILHTSTDGKWLLVRSYNYLAWVPKITIAIGDKATIEHYKQADKFLIVTGSKIYTNFVPNHPDISNLQLDMGIRLPLASHEDVGNNVYGQNPYANYIVKLPTRTSTGHLKIVLVPIPRSQDIHHGYLAFTKQNIIKQSFKFLGERYGWGHDFNGRDCTGFVGEVYKTFGILMPRNTGQQGRSSYGINHRFSKTESKANKMKIINQMKIGDLIYIPGHVMMVLGKEQGKPYIIHDVKGLGYLNNKGNLYRGTLNGVSITPFLPLYLSKSISYLDKVYNVKRIR